VDLPANIPQTNSRTDPAQRAAATDATQPIVTSANDVSSNAVQAMREAPHKDANATGGGSTAKSATPAKDTGSLPAPISAAAELTGVSLAGSSRLGRATAARGVRVFVGRFPHGCTALLETSLALVTIGCVASVAAARCAGSVLEFVCGMFAGKSTGTLCSGRVTVSGCALSPGGDRRLQQAFQVVLLLKVCSVSFGFTSGFEPVQVC